MKDDNGVLVVYSATVELKQAQDNWQTDAIDNIGGFDVKTKLTGVGANKTVTITYTQSSDTLNMTVG